MLLHERDALGGYAREEVLGCGGGRAGEGLDEDDAVIRMVLALVETLNADWHRGGVSTMRCE